MTPAPLGGIKTGSLLSGAAGSVLEGTAPQANGAWESSNTWDANGTGINVQAFDELKLEPSVVQEAQQVWQKFCSAAESREAAGEAIFSAIFEGAPSLQALFVTPRAVQAMKFMNSLHGFIMMLDSPSQIKLNAETLGFQHLNLDVSVQRVVIFRDAIMDLLELELGLAFTPKARDGWLSLLNYLGGAIVYVKANYADRLKILTDSWVKANKKAVKEKKSSDEPNSNSFENDSNSEQIRQQDLKATEKKGFNRMLAWRRTKKDENGFVDHTNGTHDNASQNQELSSFRSQQVPHTFKEMFEFNAVVMGFGQSSPWLKELLGSWDAIVTNVANSSRLQEECDVVVLRFAKATTASINLAQYRSCMLASLRSLLPKEWDSSYEVAWNWLWENVERLLRKHMGTTPLWERSLVSFMESLDEKKAFEMRMSIFERFFVAAPTGQEYLKQSDNRLHFIADRMFQSTLELFHNPWRIVDDLSALGLRHVGYGIPTDLFGPFVTSIIEVVIAATQDQTAVDAFRFAIGLISKILMRTITEGSTIVMKAINVNSQKKLKKAVSVAPRGLRASWVLIVKVGTQSISPLSWAMESGSIEAAKAIIQDLLTIRADRERYYYGVDELFERHPDIIKRLCDDAPLLLPTLLQGLVWRSTETKNGLRRVNYYVKNLVVDQSGGVSPALGWLVAFNDPKIMVSEVIVILSDVQWNRLVRTAFIGHKVWFILSWAILMLSQAILPKMETHNDRTLRFAILVLRLLTYAHTMLRLLMVNVRDIFRAYRSNNTVRVLCFPVPKYLMVLGDFGMFCLLIFLLLMCSYEPMFRCFGEMGEGKDLEEEWPTQRCDAAKRVYFEYSIVCMCAMAIHWLLLVDLAVFWTGLSAFVLVCRTVLPEIGRFLFALTFLLLTFGSAISVLEHTYYEMHDIPHAVVALFAITVRLYEDDYRDLQGEPALLAAVFLFVTISAIIILNVLIAQLNCCYVYIYADMVGFARLNRAHVIVESLSTCTEANWKKFVKSLDFDKPLEFNEGDIGLPGGLPETERANLHTAVRDTIFRFGGSCSEEMPWPKEEGLGKEDEDKFRHLEQMVGKTLKRIQRNHRKRLEMYGHSYGPPGSSVMPRKNGLAGDSEDGSASDGDSGFHDGSELGD